MVITEPAASCGRPSSSRVTKHHLWPKLGARTLGDRHEVTVLIDEGDWATRRLGGSATRRLGVCDGVAVQHARELGFRQLARRKTRDRTTQRLEVECPG